LDRRPCRCRDDDPGNADGDPSRMSPLASYETPRLSTITRG
jgi:hypothetical protein